MYDFTVFDFHWNRISSTVRGDFCIVNSIGISAIFIFLSNGASYKMQYS